LGLPEKVDERVKFGVNNVDEVVDE